MPVGLEAVFTMLSYYQGHAFTEKLVVLLCARENVL